MPISTGAAARASAISSISNRSKPRFSAAHTWDANGNLTSEGATSFGYDTENRLVSISGAKSGSLAYDPLGRLWQASTASGVVRFVYDGDRLIAEYSTSGTLLRRYVHGAGVDEPLVWYEGAAVSAPARRYLHTDHQGSVVAVSSASGAMQQIHTYDAYGVTAAANTLRFQYTGQTAIPDLGLLYYKARFYYPALGRFLQTDPIGYEDDNNLYAYVGNDPLNRLDPTGMAGSCTGSRVGAGCDFVQGSEQRQMLMAGASSGSSREQQKSAQKSGAPGGQDHDRNALPQEQMLEEVVVSGSRVFNWTSFANDWWPGYGIGSCIYGSFTGGACSASAWVWAGIGGLPIPEGKILQSGGKVISKATAKALNSVFGRSVERRDWGRALESLKRDLDLPNSHHGRIGSNGNYLDDAGNVLGNIGDYLP